ncbi:MAG: helix-turn-helix domain-containing protein [Candidatus Margulisbacteria bacterium]|nr:helix-turn-helix domain-containing protein [Candidatus Margulisiibacteriota bacterium]
MAKAENPYVPNWQIIKLVGQKIRAERLKKKMSITKLSAFSGLSYVSISRIENGHKNLTISTLYDLAKGLKIPPRDLLA